ncbi:hypothetical protein PG984_012136 [Apiospora sp. TS-2023a]
MVLTDSISDRPRPPVMHNFLSRSTKRSARVSNRVLDPFELCADVLPTKAETAGSDRSRILANSLESKELFPEDEILVLEGELIGQVCRSGAMRKLILLENPV